MELMIYFSIKEGWERLGEEALTTSQSSEYTLRTIDMHEPKPQIRESDFGTFFRFLGVLLLRRGC